MSLRVDEDHLPELEARSTRCSATTPRSANRSPGVGIEGALAVEVNGLRAFALAAALAGIAALAQAFVRQAQIMAEEDPIRRALGMTSHQLVLSGMVAASPSRRLVPCSPLPVAWLAGRWPSRGVARQAEPDPGPGSTPSCCPARSSWGWWSSPSRPASSWPAHLAPQYGRRRHDRPEPRGVLAALPPSMAVGVRMALARAGRSAPPARLALAGGRRRRGRRARPLRSSASITCSPPRSSGAPTTTPS